jgi:hypothetical protein
MLIRLTLRRKSEEPYLIQYPINYNGGNLDYARRMLEFRHPQLFLHGVFDANALPLPSFFIPPSF